MKKIFFVILILIGIILLGLLVSYLINGGEHKILNEVRINKSKSEVFDFISDMRNELKWNPDVQFMIKKTIGDVANGTKFKAKWHLSDTIEVTIQSFNKPNNITFVNEGKIEVTLIASLDAVDPSTTAMHSEFIAKPNGFTRAIFPIIKRQMEKQEKMNMINLKNYLEK